MLPAHWQGALQNPSQVVPFCMCVCAFCAYVLPNPKRFFHAHSIAIFEVTRFVISRFPSFGCSNKGGPLILRCAHGRSAVGSEAAFVQGPRLNREQKKGAGWRAAAAAVGRQCACGGIAYRAVAMLSKGAARCVRRNSWDGWF